MFESLDEHIKHSQALETTPVQRLMRWALALVVTLVVIGGLYVAIQLLEG